MCLTLAPASSSALVHATCPPRQASWSGVVWWMVRASTAWPWRTTTQGALWEEQNQTRAVLTSERKVSKTRRVSRTRRV